MRKARQMLAILEVSEYVEFSPVPKKRLHRRSHGALSEKQQPLRLNQKHSRILFQDPAWEHPQCRNEHKG